MMKALTWPNAAKLGLVVALCLNFFAVYHSFEANEEFRPLVDTSPQIVAPLNVTVNSTVDVTAIKCNNSKTPVISVGAATWQAVEHPGVSFPKAAGGLAVRQPGCTTTLYHNVIPSDVKTYVQAQGHAVAFKLVGNEIPQHTSCVGVLSTDKSADLLTKCRGGKEGTPATWFTDQFDITP